MLSAVSQQVQSIQLGLKTAVSNPAAEIELVGRQLKINTDTGIFISELTFLPITLCPQEHRQSSDILPSQR